MSKKRKLRIGVTTFSKEIPFHQELEKGLYEEAKKQGDELIVYSGDNNHTKQAEQVKALISEKVDAIVICPVDSMAIGKSIDEANKAGIPVFTADTTNMSEEGKVITHITSDNLQGGKLAGRLLARAINYEGNVAVLTHPTITSCLERERGFRESIESYPDIKLVSELPALGSREEAKKATEKLLSGKAKIKGVFAVSDESALGALNAIEKPGKAEKMFIVGYDAIPEAKTAIAEGRIYADVRQFPIKIGQETIKIINEYFEGIKVPPIVLVEVGTWT